jgi:hypothetical protein
MLDFLEFVFVMLVGYGRIRMVFLGEGVVGLLYLNGGRRRGHI